MHHPGCVALSGMYSSCDDHHLTLRDDLPQWPAILFWCIFLQQYRVHMDIGNSNNYLGIKFSKLLNRLWDKLILEMCVFHNRHKQFSGWPNRYIGTGGLALWYTQYDIVRTTLCKPQRCYLQQTRLYDWNIFAPNWQSVGLKHCIIWIMQTCEYK